LFYISSKADAILHTNCNLVKSSPNTCTRKCKWGDLIAIFCIAIPADACATAHVQLTPVKAPYAKIHVMGAYVCV
jgi:hypothetical protein